MDVRLSKGFDIPISDSSDVQQITRNNFTSGV